MLSRDPCVQMPANVAMNVQLFASNSKTNLASDLLQVYDGIYLSEMKDFYEKSMMADTFENYYRMVPAVTKCSIGLDYENKACILVSLSELVADDIANDILHIVNKFNRDNKIATLKLNYEIEYDLATKTWKYRESVEDKLLSDLVKLYEHHANEKETTEERMHSKWIYTKSKIGKLWCDVGSDENPHWKWSVLCVDEKSLKVEDLVDDISMIANATNPEIMKTRPRLNYEIMYDAQVQTWTHPFKKF